MTEKTFPAIIPIGDSALQITFGESISLKTNQKIHALDTVLQEQIPGLIYSVPTYCTLMLKYDPLKTDFSTLKASLQIALETETCGAERRTREIEIPTVYGGEFGPDLEHVAKHNQLTPEKVIALHSERAYPVFMMGFTPGFPYLGDMDPRIATPRLDSPRTRVPAGSVGIAGEQTGIYPLDSPGGWQIIGRTTRSLFSPGLADPFLIKPGDIIRFVSVKAEGRQS